MVTGLLEAYAIALRDVQDDALKTAVVQLVDEGGQHPPSAGDLRKLCLGRDSQSIEAKALEAWWWCERHADLATNPRDAEDPLVLVAIGAIGGWRQFCSAPINEWQQRNFLKAYCEAASNPQVEEVAQLSYHGQPLGALAHIRKTMGQALTTTGALRQQTSDTIAAQAQANITPQKSS